MERTMSVEEKIKRAEQIYYRRNGNYDYIPTKSKAKNPPSFATRMIKQIIVCFIIYGIFYVVTNRDYFLSQEFRTQLNETMAQNEMINNIYTNSKAYIKKYINWESNLKSQENEQIEENKQQEEVNNIETVNEYNENIGDSTEEVVFSQTDNEEKKQEQLDVEEIKHTINFIQPIKGTISSTFGWRTPTTTTVSKYHTGLDIAAKTGTIIKSATDGKVILASSEGDYGNHYKIQINDVVIIYAHCSKLYLKEGDEIHQGQEIAEVGSTGNSTRTTFTF